MKWLLIAGGGALGSVLRYLVHGTVQRLAGVNFPWGTLAVNVVGCLVIGILTALFHGPFPLREEYRLGILVGILGGFTTFSTFGMDTYVLADEGHLRAALANVLMSCALGLAAVWAGHRLATHWFAAA